MGQHMSKLHYLPPPLGNLGRCHPIFKRLTSKAGHTPDPHMGGSATLLRLHPSTPHGA